MRRGSRRKHASVEPQTASAERVPTLDEGTFQQMLEAAFVIQEQKEFRRARRPKPDATETLAEIADTQQLLLSQSLDLPAAANLIADRLAKITHATGIAIGLIRENQLEYCAATGTAAPLAPSSAPLDPSLLAFLRGDEVTLDFRSNSHVFSELLRGHGPNAPTFFPVYHEAKVAGLLQLSFPENEPIHQHEMRSCQLMAGLMAEVIARAADQEWRQALASERATMLEALEKLRPQLERLVAEPVVETPAPAPMPESVSEIESEADIAELLAALAIEPPSEGAQGSLLESRAKPPEETAEPGLEAAAQPAETPATEPAAEQAPEPSAELEISAGPVLEAAETATSPLPESKAEIHLVEKQETVAPVPEPLAPEDGVDQKSSTASTCGQCGYTLPKGELFCGRCGTPRSLGVSSLVAEPDNPAPLAHLQEEAEATDIQAPQLESNELEPALHFFSDVPALPLQHEVAADPVPATQGSSALAIEHNPIEPQTPPAVLLPDLAKLPPPPVPFIPEVQPPAVKEPQEEKPQLEMVKRTVVAALPSPWASAVKARQWLEALQQANSPVRVWLAHHRADAWVGVSIVLLWLAFSVSGTRTVPATQTGNPPPPSLTLFERMLVGLGLAQPPPAPVYAGNPNTQVWVDTHTALYYCPGSDLYGKTAGGKFTTQRDAQMDQFEPATRKSCD